ncbi:MAG: helix-turn-helix transcriptional regulator [Bacteroidales bacterium]
MGFPKENILDKWLEKNKNPEIDNFIEKNLAIVDKVHIALKDKGWTKAKFAELMGKNPSEVSKWLSGTHNLTLKSIIKMEVVLGMDLIYAEPITEDHYIFLGTIENNNNLKIKTFHYTKTFENNNCILGM